MPGRRFGGNTARASQSRSLRRVCFAARACGVTGAPSEPNCAELAQSLTISLMENAWDTAPKPRTTSVRGLLLALSRFPVAKTGNKLALPAWSPARFLPESSRSAGAVVEVSCLVLDHDGGDPEAARTSWSGVIAVAHSTWSHTVAAPRFRVVVPLARPIPAARWRAAWAWAKRRAPDADGACKDPSRLYFRPALPAPQAPHFAWTLGGRLLDLLPLLPKEESRGSRVEPTPSLLVPYRLRRHAASVRFAHDPGTRERVAGLMGATILGDAPDRRAS